MRSLEGSQTLTLTYVTSASQCHQGASIFHSGTSSPVGLCSTSLASPPVPPRRPSLLPPHPRGVCHSPVISFINAHLTSYLPATAKAGREPSEWKWWPLCPSFRRSCEGWRIREVLSDRCILLKGSSTTCRMCHFIFVTKLHRVLSNFNTNSMNMMNLWIWIFTKLAGLQMISLLCDHVSVSNICLFF